METKKRRNIVVFTTSTCPYCTMVKNYLKKNRIRFREVNIEKDRKAATDLVNRTGQMGVPVTMIDNRHTVLGFDRQKLSKILNIKRR